MGSSLGANADLRHPLFTLRCSPDESIASPASKTQPPAFAPVAKEQLVSEYFRRAVENRLTGNERRPARPFTPSFDLGGAVVSLTECTSVVWQKAVQLRKYVFRKTPPKTFTGAKSVIKVTQIVNARVSSPSEPPYLICLCTFVLSEAGDRGGRTVYLRYH